MGIANRVVEREWDFEEVFVGPAEDAGAWVEGTAYGVRILIERLESGSETNPLLLAEALRGILRGRPTAARFRAEFAGLIRADPTRRAGAKTVV